MADGAPASAATPFLSPILGPPMSDARVCPFCRTDLGPGGAPRAEHLDPGALLLVAANNPWWRPEEGLCARCAEGFAAALGEDAS